MSDYNYSYYHGDDLPEIKEEDFGAVFYYRYGKVLTEEEVIDIALSKGPLKKEPLCQYNLDYNHIIKQVRIDRDSYRLAEKERFKILEDREKEFKLALYAEYDLPPEIGDLVYAEAYSRNPDMCYEEMACSIFPDLANLVRCVLKKQEEINTK